MPPPPSGWYADPHRPGSLRYWDGQRWTEHVVSRPQRSTIGQQPAERRGRRTTAAAVWFAVTLFVVGVGVAGAGGRAAGDLLRSSAPATGTATGGSTPATGTSTGGSTPVPTTSLIASTAASLPATGTAPAPSVGSPAPPPPAASSAAGTTSRSSGGSADTAPGVVLVRVVGVLDGDTIKVSIAGVTERVRVIGIDTPELATRDCYAQEAASMMQSLVQSRTVRLEPDPTQADRDAYGRLLRHVYSETDRSVALDLIRGGFGREYTYANPYAGQVAYRRAEQLARAGGAGLWSACPSMPAAPPATPTASAAPLMPGPPAADACVIKGNISSTGEKIYHVPGQRYYAQTVITLSKGERWFCSETEAQAAGWRKSKV